MDQASSLRNLTSAARRAGNDIRGAPQKPDGSKVYLFASGKGGVGKSVISANMALSVGKKGSPVLLIDAAPRGSHLGMILGVSPKDNLQSVVKRKTPINEAIDTTLENVHLLAGTEDIFSGADYNYEMRRIVCDNINRFRLGYEIIIIDGGSSVPENIIQFSRNSTSSILVTTPEVTSITDTYAMIKYLLREESASNLQILVNQVQSDEQGKEISRRLNLMTSHFLGIEVPHAGSVPNDESLRDLAGDSLPAANNRQQGKLRELMTKIMNSIIDNHTPGSPVSDGDEPRKEEVKQSSAAR